MSKKLFHKVSDSERKDAPILVRLSKSDSDTIRHSAAIRQLSVSEFMRRSALGRKADVDYETEIVLSLGAVTRAIRGMHTALVERGIPPQAEEWRPVILEARAAILRISK
jgi:uncharacterized protein (DUF1778 family)